MKSTTLKEKFVVGIAGGTASGKGLFAKLISDQFPKQALIIGLDSYYKDQRSVPINERILLNVDNPNAFDFDLAYKDILKAIDDHPVEIPHYDYEKRIRDGISDRYPAAPVIIVEGLLALSDQRLVDLFNLKIFIEADADLRLARRVLRDIREKRHETLEYSINQYLTSARPAHKIYVEPQKAKADLVVDWNEINTPEIEKVVGIIKSKIAI